MDFIRQDIDSALRSMRRSLAKVRSDLASGTVDWKDDERSTAVEHWASWGLRVARTAATDIEVLDLDVRWARMSEDERREVDSLRVEVASAVTHFVSQGGRLLPGDMPNQ